ncbi:MAG TPA: GntR family transcriptional regulator [Candidatus Eisenbacteria bacterium]|uniref:GntR family transcriptional regulator n=1 Tax=Eiseniibacteriota bacterium TaxID=2212470 RepID=A0A7V2ATR5_UNCEI|nr:GntR family transcriptional regulator [Candidatus Eisenbacteria bacterium]
MYCVYTICTARSEQLFIVISPLNPDPLYKQVTDQVKDAVADGTLAAGERLPSIREMARALRISAITIKRAYADLEGEGVIVTRAGLGSFVAEVSREGLRAEKLEEIRGEIGRIVKTGEKFGITPDDVIGILREHKE